MTSEKRTGDGSSGRSPPHREEQVPPPKSFGIRIENPDLIFKAVEDGISGEIGKVLLESPVGKVSAKLESKRDVFNLLGEVSINYEARHKHKISDEAIRKAIAQRYLNNPDDKIIERGGNLIITAPRGTKIVLSENFITLHGVTISTGLIIQNIGELQLVPSPASTRESFDTVIADFIDVFKATVEEIYKVEGKTPNDEELVLHPPKISSDRIKKQGGLFDSITPDELLGEIEIGKQDVKFEDIGGQEVAKRSIEVLAFALRNPELYRNWGTKPPKGIILYGPPGTGKTLMAKALASQADARFFHVKVSDIVSKWYGESERIVRGIFELAGQSEGNTIIFFDEIDAIAYMRERSDKLMHRVLSTLLENMDGMDSYNNVMVVASTNMLDVIDPALLRAGRFDRWIEVPLPDQGGRRQILNIHMAIAEKMAGRKLFTDIDVDMLASVTDGYSGADIAETIRRTLEEKVRQEGTLGHEPEGVTTEDIKIKLFFYEKKKPS